MPCAVFPPTYFPSPPSLPGGVGLPTFVIPVPQVGFCCAIRVPPFGDFPLPPLPPFTALTLVGLVALIASINAEIQLVFDHLAIPCPTE